MTKFTKAQRAATENLAVSYRAYGEATTILFDRDMDINTTLDQRLDALNGVLVWSGILIEAQVATGVFLHSNLRYDRARLEERFQTLGGKQWLADRSAARAAREAELNAAAQQVAA